MKKGAVFECGGTFMTSQTNESPPKSRYSDPHTNQDMDAEWSEISSPHHN